MSKKSKSDAESAVKPQVIDLDAEEVKIEDGTAGATESNAEALPPDVDADAEPSASDPPDADVHASDRDDPEEPETVEAEPTPPPAPPKRKSRGNGVWIAGALIAGLAIGGWLYRDVLSAYLPTNEMTDLKARLDAAEANTRTLAEQIAAVNQSADKATQAASAIDSAVKETATGLTSTNSRIDGFESRVASAEDAIRGAKNDLAELRTAVSQVGTGAGSGTGTVDSAALAAIGQRLDVLEKDVASLKSASGSSGTANLTSALSQALSDLKAKIATGAAFQSEYDRIARMVPAAPGLDVLATHAATGLPNAQGLAAELTAAIPALPQPEAPPPASDGGYWDSFTGMLSGIVTIRDIGDTDWPQLAQRCVGLAEAGDLTQAIGQIDGAEGTKPSALLQWHDRAAARLRLEAAVGQVSEAVIRQITALGGAQ